MRPIERQAWPTVIHINCIWIHGKMNRWNRDVCSGIYIAQLWVAEKWRDWAAHSTQFPRWIPYCGGVWPHARACVCDGWWVCTTTSMLFNYRVHNWILSHLVCATRTIVLALAHSHMSASTQFVARQYTAMSLHSNSLESTIMHNALEWSDEQERKNRFVACARLCVCGLCFSTVETVDCDTRWRSQSLCTQNLLKPNHWYDDNTDGVQMKIHL